jgi:hypothetical protein
MPGLYIARRYLNENGTTRAVDYHFDSREKAEKFIEHVRLNTPEDQGHGFDLLSHSDQEVVKHYESRED